MTHRALAVLIACGLIFAVSGFANIAWAEDSDERRPPPPPRSVQGERKAGPPPPLHLPRDWEPEDLREMIEALRFARLSQALDLSEEETVLLIRRQEEFQKEIRDLYQERHKRFQELRKLINEDAEEDAVKEKLEKLREVEHRLEFLKLDAFEHITKDMNAKQKAKFYIYMQDFERDIRRLIFQARERARHYTDKKEKGEEENHYEEGHDKEGNEPENSRPRPWGPDRK